MAQLLVPGWPHTVRIDPSTYVTYMEDATLVAKPHLEAFGEVRPAATIVDVSALDDPERIVEIEAYAIVEQSL